MALLGFNERFASHILEGSKCQTIRAVRKYPIVPGETLYLYTGLRTKHSQKIGEVKCESIEDISIHFDPDGIFFGEVNLRNFQASLTHDELNLFAKSDGFKNWMDMKDFWIYTHGSMVLQQGFKGILIRW